MTIDSGWLHAFKEEVPEAFGARPSFIPNAVFVDGQIRLMQRGLRDDESCTWEDFICRQFVRPLSRFLDTCDTVILAFDNYEKVPNAKSMTQLQRRRHTPVVEFRWAWRILASVRVVPARLTLFPRAARCARCRAWCRGGRSGSGASRTGRSRRA